MIVELAECGFSQHEQRVLSFLLQHGAAPARAVASATRLKRPTAYLTLQNLVDSGFVTKKMIGGVALFTSVARESLPEMIRTRARARLVALEGVVNRLEDSLRALAPAPAVTLGGFSVESLESARGLYRELYESLSAGNYLGIFNPQHAITAETKPIISDFLSRTARSKPSIREIAVEGAMCDWYLQRIKNPNHMLKVLPRDTHYITDLMMVKDTLVFLDYSRESLAAIKITHRNLYLSFTALFEALWRRLS
jgi:hypothetical protein